MSSSLIRHLPTYAWMAAGAMLVGGLAACGTGNDGSTTEVAAAPAAVAPTDRAPAAADAAGGSTGAGSNPAETVLVNRLATGLGTVATDASGLTLYRFDKDTNKPPHSACEGVCTDNWLPLTTTALPAPGAGVDGSLLGTVERSDGTQQATLKGWPLYRFVGDEQPGDINGEGIQGIWHAIAPNGKFAPGAKVAQDAKSGTGSPTSAGGAGRPSGGNYGYGY